ncbi:MAG: helix-turn-helix transcriptional regulator [Actinomycetota bacterium]
MDHRVQGPPGERELLTLQEVARRLGVPNTTIYSWRHRGTGPKGHRIGKHVRYWWSDLMVCSRSTRTVASGVCDVARTRRLWPRLRPNATEGPGHDASIFGFPV